MKISDDQLANWTKPWFENEEEKAETTKELVKNAISRGRLLNPFLKIKLIKASALFWIETVINKYLCKARTPSRLMMPIIIITLTTWSSEAWNKVSAKT
jgi:hypothetical protein